MTKPIPGARKGRPPKGPIPLPVRFAMRLGTATVEEIERRAAARGVTPSEIARELIERGLASPTRNRKK